MSSVADFDFELPPHLIAQEPRPRGRSRLLVVDRAAGSWREHTVTDLPALLAPGDCLVANDTRVFPARLIGRRDPSGGAAECFLLERRGDREWLALVHPGQKLKPGAQIVFDDPVQAPHVRIRAVVRERQFFGRRLVELVAEGTDTIDDAVDRLGHMPLPPYIHRDDNASDRERYQTVFANARGSVAAPTAGLHFTEKMIADVRRAGIAWTTITHHVGYGTFKPVRVETVEEHTVDPESYEIGAEAAGAIDTARQSGRRIVAVGTTTTRALESAAIAEGVVRTGRGTTDLFIRPGYHFGVVDALVTNFHLPRSSLLMLVSAFAGRELILAAYRHAVASEFRFYSYGDAMLVL
jgi:S-adenosylmethionine:tRNA ribosyltransferase-isomerase